MKTIKLLSTIVFVLCLPAFAFAADYITCESDGAYRYCPAPRYSNFQNADIRLDKQYSKNGCQRGYSWGIERDGIWVDRGCRARFVILEYRDRPGSPDYDRDDRYGRDDPYSQQGGLFGSQGKSYNQLRKEREALELEKEKLRLERERLELQNSQANISNSCPAGAKPGRCSDFDRKRGCKDWRLSNGLGCRTN